MEHSINRDLARQAARDTRYWWRVSLSFLLFTAALVLPIGGDGWFVGTYLLMYGWILLLAGKVFSWVANPLLITAYLRILLNRKPGSGLTLSALACLFMLSHILELIFGWVFFGWRSWPLYIYYFWLGSALVLYDGIHRYRRRYHQLTEQSPESAHP